MGFHAANLNSVAGVAHNFGTVNEVGRPSDLFYCSQQNSSTVIEIGKTHPTGIIVGDAVFTRTTRPIGIITADCLPILLTSSSEPFVAVIHAGWKGLFSGIIRNSVEAYRGAGVTLRDLKLAIGPSIGPCCYEVRPPLIEAIEDKDGNLWRGKKAPWAPHSNELPHPLNKDSMCLDLKLYCCYLLDQEGLNCSQIELVDTCTYCSDIKLGSYRRRNHNSEEKTFQYSWIKLSDR
ncbi:D-alanyl-alanine synthetase [Pseudomonas sp. SDI]|uniref:polyphenol oxidase family protein n=1 Tax=Pseudomonas sp. SDI TaxID=2170734 RepID=UPI000DE6C5A9|nr:D-alanyl-alanine synthetase [Pseudomonas sp. SDI]